MLFNSFERSNETKKRGNKRKRFYGKMQGNFVLGGWVYENPIGLSMYDGPMETFEYIWVNIWCILDKIIGFCHRVDPIGIQLIN